MNRIDILLVCLALSGAAHGKPLLEQTLVACPPQLCGADARSKAAMTLDSGAVVVAPTGRVTVSIQGLRDSETGEILAHARLELRYGMIYDREEHTQYLGYLFTDAEGNYRGPVIGGMQGKHHDPYKPYKFGVGSVNAGSFLVSKPSEDQAEGLVGPQTQFISGFAVTN